MSDYETDDDFDNFLNLNIKNLEDEIKIENKKYEIFEANNVNNVKLSSIYLNRKNEVYDL